MELLEAWEHRIPGRHRVQVEFFGRLPTTDVLAVPAVKALETALADAGYVARQGSPIGSFAARYIGGGALQWDDVGNLMLRSPDTGRPVSLHSVPIALDVEYDRNPYVRSDVPARGFGTDPRFYITEAHVLAGEAITNTYGERLWTWLGWIGDTMHWQLNQPPDRCLPADQEDEMAPDIDLETWTAKLRPEDVDRMAALGVITEAERVYWREMPEDNYQDLRDAWNVRREWWLP